MRAGGTPQPFTLLGAAIVPCLDGNGRPAAPKGRCCHRTRDGTTRLVMSPLEFLQRLARQPPPKGRAREAGHDFAA